MTVLGGSGATVWVLLGYTQDHSLAAVQASDATDKLQTLAGLSLQAPGRIADLARLRAEGLALGTRLQAEIADLRARGIETQKVGALEAIVQAYFARLQIEGQALAVGDTTAARQISVQAAATTFYSLGRLRPRMAAAFDSSIRRTDAAVRAALVGLVAVVTCGIAGAVMALQRGRRRQLLERADYDARARFESMVRHSSDLILVLDPEGQISYVSPSVRPLLGYDPADWVGGAGFGVIHPDHVFDCSTAFERARTGGSPVTFDTLVRNAADQWRVIEVSFAPLNDDHTPSSVLITGRDVSERRALEAELRHQAFEDALTGLPNRAWLLEALDRPVADGIPSRGGVAILLMDLDGFKEINDGFGHREGDEVLVAVARRLTGTLGSGHRLIRLGGDEFVVVIQAADPARAALDLGDHLQVVMSDPVRVGSHEHRIGLSAGTAVAEVGTPGDELLRNADLAMYEAKFLGGGRVVAFEQRMHDAARRRVELRMDLDWAVDRGEMVLHYQPTYDLEHGTVVGAEALVRWQHPVHGLLGPGDFIPLAERGGQIAGVGRWVLAEACRHAAAWGWRSRRQSPKSISVNVSGRQLLDPGFVDVVRVVLSETALDPATLVLEITETVLMEDNAPVLERIAELKRIGVRLALDDYGTGYSSMSRLASIPVDVLKIDRRFVTLAASGDNTAQALVKSMVSLCDDLDMVAVGEGIETAAEAAQLLACGCTLGQGYLLGRPQPAQEFERLLFEPRVSSGS